MLKLRLVVILVLLSLLNASRGFADDAVTLRDDSVAHIERAITKQAKQARRARLLGSGGLLALGGLGAGVGTMGLVMRALDDDSRTRSDDPFLYFYVGSSVVAMGLGAVLLASDSPEERVYEATRHATAREARQVIAIEARRTERRRSIMRGVGLGFLAVSAATFVAFGVSDVPIDSESGNALVLGGTAAGAAGFTLTLASFARSPVERMHDELPRDMGHASRPPAQRVSAGVMPARGGAMVGIGGAF